MENFIFGIRPVIEALKGGKELDKILIKKDLSGANVPELLSLVKEMDVVCQRVPVEKLNRLTRKNHQGVIAYISTVVYHKIEDIVPRLFEEGKIPLLLILDGVTDVRNFGAIARTCECAGVDAIVIPEKGSVSVSADAVKTSAGALLTLPVCREKDLKQAVLYLKECGINVISTYGGSNINYTNVDYIVPTAIVMGNEEKGVSGYILKNSTELVAIPQFGNIQSLNVSVAAGIVIYEAVRQRMNNDMVVE